MLLKTSILITIFLQSFKLETLVNHWPMLNLNDAAGGANLVNGVNYSFVADRFKNPKEAIQFNFGFLKISKPIWFTGDFSITFWFKLISYSNDSRILLFIDEFNSHRLSIFCNDGFIITNLFKETVVNQPFLTSAFRLDLNVWLHVAYTFQNGTGFLYLNGLMKMKGKQSTIKNVTMVSNWVGGIPVSNSVFDELKIYEGTLSSVQILDNFEQGSISQIILMSHWPMDNLSDIVGDTGFLECFNYSLTFDRSNNPNSAIYFNHGYLNVPSSISFSSDFSITVWIKLNSYQPFPKIIDFGKDLEYLWLGLNGSKISGGFSSNSLMSSNIIELNDWYHVAFVLKKNSTFLYVNGVDVGKRTINGTVNYIGKCNDSVADATYDELKIYKGGLSSVEILAYYTYESSLQSKLNKPK